MLIRLSYDIQFDLPCDVPFVGLVNVRPSRAGDLRESEEPTVEPAAPVTCYIDSFGNHCTRFLARKGDVRLYSSTLIEVSGAPDPVNLSAREVDVQDLPQETLIYLLGSRYCEVDLLSNAAAQMFGALPRGDGSGSRRCAIGFTAMQHLAMPTPAPPGRRSKSSTNG